MDCFDLLAVQGTLKSLLQHHSPKALILWHSAFFMVQLSHPYMTTGKTIALTIQTFVSKVMSLLSNTLSRFVIAFLPRSKHLLILWLQSPSAVILEPKEITSVIASIFSLSICLEVLGPDATILVFCWVSSQLSHSPLSSSIGSLVPLYFLPLKWHHLISEVIDISAKCLCLQQCWFCEIPQMWTWLPLTMKWTVPQNSFEMLLLVSYSDGCHFNASPNELRPETCQLPLINLPASGLPCTIPQE